MHIFGRDYRRLLKIFIAFTAIINLIAVMTVSESSKTAASPCVASRESGNSIEAYYINLDRSVDRRDFMEAQFKTYNIKGERVRAVRPVDIDIPADVSIPPKCNIQTESPVPPYAAATGREDTLASVESKYRRRLSLNDIEMQKDDAIELSRKSKHKKKHSLYHHSRIRNASRF
jgi:hypothetical protein